MASRINWGRKSENVRALALELNLGLSEFLFLDDNRLNVEQARAVGMVAHRVAGVIETSALLRSLGLLDDGIVHPATEGAAAARK